MCVFQSINGAIYLWRVVVPSVKIVLNLFRRSYHVKEDHIGSVVSEILGYIQTDRHTHTDPFTLLYGFDKHYSSKRYFFLANENNTKQEKKSTNIKEYIL